MRQKTFSSNKHVHSYILLKSGTTVRPQGLEMITLLLLKWPQQLCASPVRPKLTLWGRPMCDLQLIAVSLRSPMGTPICSTQEVRSASSAFSHPCEVTQTL